MESSQPQSLGSVLVKELEKSDTPPSSTVSHKSQEEPKEHAITSPLVQKVEDSAGNKDAELARVVSEKRLALIKAWEESEKTKAENRAYKKLSAVGLWESKKKASVEAQLKIIEENLERKKAEYAEKMKNKVADIHRSVIGFLGALKRSSILLWIYLILLCFILVGILVFTVLAFIVTNNGSGHSVAGLRYKEYQLQDYSSWFLKQINNSHNWEHLRGCLVKSQDCNTLSKRYKTLKQYKSAKLTPIEAGCCRPPSECGYLAVNASYYDLTFHPISSNIDCKRYKNSRAIKCYDCDSCKAGVAQYMKTEWRVVAIFNVALFLVLCIIYFVGCCARRSAARNQHSKG
ncbi:hypothetical protein PIB30_000694 [Stylosanthes scabra]|uniref:Tetraspanin-10 n=1 Tax=Stylosanthes scabra TaxID=79078 RepID=A0ABU6Y0S0_9FABA|nr:hypothetical protein [Stylosanthes scabra]